MHDHNNEGSSWKKWGMMFVCVLPLLLLAFWGFGGRAVSAPSWLSWGGIALMVGLHMFMMGGSHKHSQDEHDMMNKKDNNKEKDTDKKSQSGGGCCH